MRASRNPMLSSILHKADWAAHGAQPQEVAHGVVSSASTESELVAWDCRE